MKKAIRRIDLGKAALYGAVLAGFWALVFGIYLWIVGWIFGAQAWFIDMNLATWTSYTFQTFLSVIWRMFVSGLGGAIAGFFVALIYNAVAGMMGGVVIELNDAE